MDETSEGEAEAEELELCVEVQSSSKVRARPTSRRHDNDLHATNELVWACQGCVMVADMEQDVAAHTTFSDGKGQKLFQVQHKNKSILLIAPSKECVAACTDDRVHVWNRNAQSADGKGQEYVLKARARCLKWNDSGKVLAIMQDRAVLVWPVHETSAPFRAASIEEAPSLRAICWFGTRLFIGNQLGQVASLEPSAGLDVNALVWKDLAHNGAVCSLESGPLGVLALCGTHAVDQVRESVELAAGASKSMHSFGLKEALNVSTGPATAQTAPSEAPGGVLGSLLNIAGAQAKERAQLSASVSRVIVRIAAKGEAEPQQHKTMARRESALFVSGLHADSQFAIAFASHVEIFSGSEVLAQVRLGPSTVCRGVALSPHSTGHPLKLRLHVLLDAKAASSESSNVGNEGDFANSNEHNPAAGRFFFGNLEESRRLVLRTFAPRRASIVQQSAQEREACGCGNSSLLDRMGQLEARLEGLLADQSRRADLEVARAARMDRMEAKLDAILALVQQGRQ
ncbi:Hypothetical Protein FCC1311_106482 [Hondaea fermentalgiana]|uniref:Uncharacterized protein n=1 Tax=Hondaea fermentalgiana TaxID=2315210 RepID=A0A2R5H226_9STRA|nr:Hypothetical Protein FCC1311_106482 [Hondaea fermentalgiana]|eukprot:GBG34424.1 Hypothetical Protein FCC1311_106482 [Hondaea fermentalgiana]